MPSEAGTDQNTSTETKIKDELVSPSNLRHLAVLLLLLFLSFLSYHGILSSILDYIINDHVFQVSRDYLDQASKTTEKTLAIVSGLKVILALIQSSQGGISFIVDVNVQLGQMMNVIVELINISWMVSIASLFSIKVLGILLDLSRFSMAPLMTLFFAVYGVSYGLGLHFPQFGGFFSHLSRSGLFLVIIAHLVIPLTVYVSASVSYFFYSDNTSTIHQSYQSIGNNMSKHNPDDGLHDQVKNTISAFSKSQKSVHGDARNYTHLTMGHAVFAIAEYVLTPLILLIALVVLVRTALIKLWQGSI